MANRISEHFPPVYVLKPGDHNAGVDGDSVNIGLMGRFRCLIAFGSLTGNAKLSMYSGASAGTKTTQETFRYRLADAAQGASGGDQFGDWSTSSELTLTAATYQNKLLVVEIDSRDVTADQPWVTLNLSSDASALNAAVTGDYDPRYMAHDPPTVIE